MKIKALLLATIIFLAIFLSGCWSSHEVNTLAISVAIGFDKSPEGYLITEQVINPKAVAAQKGASESPVVIFTAEGDNLEETIRSMTIKYSRTIYNSHLRMVIISEEIAREGITDIMEYLTRSHEYRTDYYIVIAKGSTANEILSTLTPVESIPGVEIYNRLKLSNKEWALTRAVRVIELTNALASDGINPSLMGIEIIGNNEESNSLDALQKSDEINILEYKELAIFKDDKLIGWMKEDEVKGFNYLTDNVKRTVAHLHYRDVDISCEVLDVKSKMKATVEYGKPVIAVTIKLTYNIGAIAGDFDVTKGQNKEIVDRIVEERVREMCNKSLKKAKELESDVYGFGEAVHRADPDYWKIVKNKWDSVFVDLPVRLYIDADIKKTGETRQSYFLEEKH